MWRLIAGQITGVHADASMDSEEVWHCCSPEDCSPGSGVFVGLYVLSHDLPVLVDVISVKARDVLSVFLNDSELTGRRIVTLSTGRDDWNTDDLIAFIEISPLLIEIDHYPGLAFGARSVPIENFVSIFFALQRESSLWNKPIRRSVPGQKHNQLEKSHKQLRLCLRYARHNLAFWIFESRFKAPSNRPPFYVLSLHWVLPGPP
jgi:hypothetical protein